MRRLTRHCTTAALAMGLLTLSGVGLSAQATEPIYRVDLNKTQILRLPASAGSIVIGNPAIADVTLHSPSMIFVVGRGYGETNLVVLDRDGETMVDANIQVTAMTPSHGVRLFNAKSRETYSCAPYCQPSPVLGDNAAFVGANAPQTGSALQNGPIFDTGSGGLSGPLDGGLVGDAGDPFLDSGVDDTPF